MELRLLKLVALFLALVTLAFVPAFAQDGVDGNNSDAGYDKLILQFPRSLGDLNTLIQRFQNDCKSQGINAMLAYSYDELLYGASFSFDASIEFVLPLVERLDYISDVSSSGKIEFNAPVSYQKCTKIGSAEPTDGLHSDSRSSDISNSGSTDPTMRSSDDGLSGSESANGSVSGGHTDTDSGVAPTFTTGSTDTTMRSSDDGLSGSESASRSVSGGHTGTDSGVPPTSTTGSTTDPTPSPGTGGSASDYLHELTGVARLHSELGLSGKGVKIGIIDSGVDYTHPDLGDCWMTPGCPFQYGYNFVEGNNDPRDNCNGHGTHVAGIVAGQGRVVTGVAPNATFGIYKVLDCNSYASDEDVVILALERAYKDGMDIINISLGNLGWKESALAVAASNLVSKGITVVASGGNDGTLGLFTVGQPAVGEDVFAVGSYVPNNVMNRVGEVMTPSGSFEVTLYSSINFFTFSITNATPLVLAGGEDATGCEPLDSVSMKGKIVVTTRGGCLYDVKASNAKNAGAAGLIVVNDSDAQNFIVVVSSTDSYPIAGVSQSDGNAIIAAIKAAAVGGTSSATQGGITFRAIDKFASGPNPIEQTGDISLFSPWGPDPELYGVPSVMAPGSMILSTYPTNMGSYAELSGTSMAAPYISGIAALVLEARKDQLDSRKDVKYLIAQTAKPQASTRSASVGRSPLRQGNGYVDAYAAATYCILADRESISLNYTTSTKQISKQFTVRNICSSKSAVVTVENLAAESVTQLDAEGHYIGGINVDVAHGANVFIKNLPESNSFDLSPGESFTVEFAVTPPEYDDNGEEWWFFGGYLFLTAKYGDGSSERSVVRYTGFKGDYPEYPYFSNDPLLAPQLYFGNEVVSEDEEYTLYDDSQFTLKYNGIRPSREIKIQIMTYSPEEGGGYYAWFPFGWHKYAGTNPDYTNPARVFLNTTAYKTADAKVARRIEPGAYRAKIHALKLFRTPGSKEGEDYYMWWSTPFTVKDVITSDDN